jgi:hypothetical protein
METVVGIKMKHITAKNPKRNGRKNVQKPRIGNRKELPKIARIMKMIPRNRNVSNGSGEPLYSYMRCCSLSFISVMVFTIGHSKCSCIISV